MIRAIVAIDSKRGMANDSGIPWKLPTDIKYFRDKTSAGHIMMGYGTYVEFTHPFHGDHNFVATTKTEPLRPGFEAIPDARTFLKNQKEDVWMIGGAGLLEQTLDLMDELYITQLDQDFNCTKFFPEYKDKFQMVSETKPQTENAITFSFQIWRVNRPVK